MCCRFYVYSSSSDERERKILSLMERDYPGGYKTGEIFPGDTAPAVLGENGRLRHAPAVFGFPGFGKNRLIINARSETVAEKPAFAGAFRERRAIIPADGFFEWSRGGEKKKYLFTLEEPQTLWLCGLFVIADGQCRFVILTRPANESMIEIHDRMPVIAPPDGVRAYLTDLNAAKEIVESAAPALCRQACDAGEFEL